jgi:hypothetical protein
MKTEMEVSEPINHLPLDFSVTMMNIKFKQEPNNNNPVMQLQENNSSTSAFKVVTPRGKTDGKFYGEIGKRIRVFLQHYHFNCCHKFYN